MDSFYNPFRHQDLERRLDHYFSAPVFSRDDVERVIEIGESCKQESGQIVYKNRMNLIIRRSKVAWVRPEKMKFAYDKVWNVLEKLNQKHWGFDIDGLQFAQYTTYGPLCHYFYHMDVGAEGDTGERKLSVSVNLTDPSDFIGGKLKIISGRCDINYPQQDLGTMTAFPSYLLHRVRPVWWGTRRSLVFWATGKPFS